MVGEIILSLSAAVLLLMGGAGMFAAPEVASWLGASDPGATALVVQLAGCGMLGFALQNWLSRKNRIGGIYARPLGLANLLLFAGAALSIGKAVASKNLPMGWLLLLASFAGLAIGFAWLIFLHDPLADVSPAKGTAAARTPE